MDAIMAVLIFIMEKIKEKPDPNAKPAIDFDNKTAAEREKQVSCFCLHGLISLL
jgi:RNA-binding protein Nova